MEIWLPDLLSPKPNIMHPGIQVASFWALQKNLIFQPFDFKVLWNTESEAI